MGMPPISSTTSSAAAIRRAETLLKKVGFNPGKVDGVENAALTTAVKEFQTAWGGSGRGRDHS